jgi:type I restriction enzyme S subunit|nr:restriction endonuclease subunit S [Mediterraneibacter faecis]
MKLNYEPLSKHIQLVDYRNSGEVTSTVLGISIDKEFMPSVANVIGTDLSRYKLISKGLFACNPMHVGRDERLPIALYEKDIPAIVSPAYFMFEIIDRDVLNEEYLMMWFRRPEFDRECWFMTDGSVRGGITWDDLCRIKLPVPSYERQCEIVESYRAITDRIALKRAENDNLANTEQAILVETVINNHTVPTALGDLVDFIDGDRGKNYPTFDEFTSTGYCLFLNASNVTSTGFNFDNCMFVSEEKDKLMNKGHLSPYDIVLTSRGTIGNVALYDKHIKYENARINSGMLIIRPKTKRLSPYFIYALLKSSYMKAAVERFKSGSAQPQLPIKDLQKITFEIPESDTVLVALDRQFLAVEESISINNNEIDNLKELSNVLLAELSR